MNWSIFSDIYLLHYHFYPHSVDNTTKLCNPNNVCLNKYIIFALCATDSCVIISCGEQLHRRLCLSVCVCVPVMPFYHVLITGSLWSSPDIGLMKCLWPIQFQVKRSKVQVTCIIQNFCRVRSVAPCLFGRSALYLEQICSVLFWLCPY